jgi:hypothetical protein
MFDAPRWEIGVCEAAPVCLANDICHDGVNGRHQDGASAADDGKNRREENDMDGNSLAQG